MKARIVYQALLFFNSTLLYSLAIRSTDSRDLLFFSAFIAALSLLACLAMQLSITQFQSAIGLLKVASIVLLLWVCLRSGISPPAIALGISVLVIALTHRDALVGSPSQLSIILVLAVVTATSLWLVLARLGVVNHHSKGVLLLLILPYLLTAIANRPKHFQDKTGEAQLGRLHISTLILAQLMPTASSFVMLTSVSYETNITAVAGFVMMERAVAIGGSLVSFYVRVRGTLAELALSVVAIFLLLGGSIVASTIVAAPTWLVIGTYLAAGALLAYGTISLAARYPVGMLIINGTALFALLLVTEYSARLQPIQLLAIYICPQLLLMGGLLAFASRQNAYSHQ
jgi:hypothetical protein